MQIRAARVEDADAVSRRLRDALPEPWSPAQVAAEIALAASRGWVALPGAGEGGEATQATQATGPREAMEIVGVLLARRAADELEILQLAVSPEGRRAGTGRALVEHALRSEPEARAVFLEVSERNAGARAFYRALGFTERGRRPGYYRDGAAAILLGRPGS